MLFFNHVLNVQSFSSKIYHLKHLKKEFEKKSNVFKQNCETIINDPEYYICIFKICTSNINTTILTQITRYLSISKKTLFNV